MTDKNKLVRTLQENETDGEKLCCEIEDSTKRYAKTVTETPADRGAVKVAKFLQDHEIGAVTFDKGTGFSVMNRQSYHKKLAHVLFAPKFKKLVEQGITML